MRAFVARHRSLAVTTLSGIVVAALVTTAALVSGGYAAQRMDLDDAAVWVSNGTQQLLGRANTQISRLNSVVAASSRTLDVVQSGQTVLLVDQGSNAVGIVDPATAELGKTTPLPSRSPTIALAGDRAVVGSEATGQFWMMAVDQLPLFSAQVAPTVDLGSRVVSSVEPDGTMFAFSADASSVYRIDAAQDDAVDATTAVPSGTGRATQITSIGGRWAVLNASARTLSVAERTVPLPDWLGTDAVLQQPADSGSRFYVASRTGLVAVGPTGTVTTILRASLGAPAAPVQRGDCAYAAWTGGTAWQDCDGARTRSTLAGVPAGASLVFRANGDDVLVNDRTSGASWSVQHGGARIDNWDELITKPTDDRQQQENSLDTPPEYDKTQEPPVAVDDDLGARPGRVTSLPVLLNDYDPNGDVLVVSAVDDLPAEQGTLDLVDDDQQVQLTLPDSASGTLSFGYTITDGRGGTASATVTVTVRSADENAPPVQVRTTKGTVQSGGRITSQVLGDWYDPDGDPFYLESAQVAAPDAVSSTPDGTVVYSDRGEGGTLKSVALTVSDGTASGSGAFAVTVRAAGEVPIIAEPFVVIATSGEEVTVSPLAHVRGGTGTVRLSAVPSRAGATITPDYDGGTFRFASDTVGTDYLEYAVTDGVTTGTGVVRIEVQAPPEAKTKPIPVPHTAFIQEQSSDEVDVLATDLDPAGGVLLITGATAPAQSTGVRVEILEQRILRVTLTRPLEGPVSFGYRISNGLADAEGQVTVVQIARPAIVQPPVANPDTVSVRVGDVIDIPVLTNDEQPDGDALTLNSKLATALPSGAGLLFASGSVLRYLAPSKPGNYTAAYRVDAPDGQWATAQVTIAVRELDASTNNPPVPKTVTARVFAGQTVTIPIPLSGVDPDGDSVQLLGQDTNPEKGAVVRVTSDSIQYEAGEYSAGTDTFGYTVVDALGARATGEVRVGIAPPVEGARNPVANPDEATVRPGRTVSVQVLTNDSDPDGSRLEVTGVRATGTGAKATVRNDVVRVSAPERSGQYGFIYTIQNETGGTSSNFLTVTVSKDAPLARPEVTDTSLTLSDVLSRKSVRVDVLANVFFADGPASSLRLSVLSGWSRSAQVVSGKRIRVVIRQRSQIIPFKVAHPLDSSVAAYGFIRVPGYDDALPQLKRGAPRLSVPSESQLSIDLDDYVVAVGGRSVRLTDASSVRATHANGDSLVANGHTLVYTSADRYFGPASISFEVTDGTSTADPSGRVATLVLPITVTPRTNQPPAFTGASLEVEPGSTRTLDLTKLTSYPYTKDLDELQYTLQGQAAAGVQASLQGRSLTLEVADSVARGSSASLSVGVADSVNQGRSGRIQLTVVPSTRPLAVPADDAVVAPRGRTTTVDVLANDRAGNPFPGTPLKVVAVRGISGGGLPDGMTITPSADNSRLSVQVSDQAQPGDANVQYEVADATGDPSRYVWGSVRLSVQDRPDPVQNLQTVSIADQSITVSWAAGNANNSPITGYEVSVARADGSAAQTVSCQATVCSVPTPGNGPSNAVRLTVVAKNSIGASDGVSLENQWSDIVPPAPTGVGTHPRDGAIHVTWTRPGDYGGSPVQSYVVTAGSTSVVSGCRDDTCSIDVPSDNGVTVMVSVSARNSTPQQFSRWNQSAPVSGYAAGPPQVVAQPTAVASTDGSGNVSVGFSGVFAGNGRGISQYAVVAGGAPTCSVSDPGADDPGIGFSAGGGQVKQASTDAAPLGFTVQAGSATTFTVFASNGQGCARAQVTATPRSAPSPPTIGLTAGAGGEFAGEAGQRYSFVPRAQSIISTSAPSADGTASFEYEFDGGTSGPQAIAEGQSVNPSENLFGTRARVHARQIDTYPGGVRIVGDWGPWSDRVTPVLIVFTPTWTASADDPTSGTFSWDAAPSGAGYDVVQYLCSGMAGFAPLGQTGSCDATSLVGPKEITVRVSANGQTYDVTYQEN